MKAKSIQIKEHGKQKNKNHKYKGTTKYIQNPTCEIRNNIFK